MRPRSREDSFSERCRHLARAPGVTACGGRGDMRMLPRPSQRRLVTHAVRVAPCRRLQRQVAERLGVDETTVTNWELNRTTPALRFLPAIIRFLGSIRDAPAQPWPNDW
jgi:transcriptional regulator with XRE-family HTH domain